ncbi:hypothetical protein BTN50_1929 [Candidatus Enterovibrio altilux]|uniref:Mobile element protein n=1 Tax=Candidatus Enterovibrio altilux TaxID=1927128 RepID=A0A291BBI1_9GAMM|nr:hypothetical protein BTN50_1929 [Candidatus Enterovibrio luxaltus]
MVQVKKSLGETLSLRAHNVQISETYAMVQTLKKLTGQVCLK